MIDFDAYFVVHFQVDEAVHWGAERQGSECGSSVGVESE
jgi:hypothetical protein